ncbi:class I SAM-dependent methyltransferase [soil metagenome]
MDGYSASTYGDRFADVYDDWYGTISDTEATVTKIAALAGDGAVLELGVGSGRLAVPLARRGVEIVGIDASTAMVEQLRAKPDGERVTVTVGDMAELDLGDRGAQRFAVVLIAYNTFFNLTTAEAQQRCLQQVVGRLAAGGRLVVEAFVPTPEPDGPEEAVTARSIGADAVVLSVSRRDPATHTLTGSYVQLTEAGVKLRPWFLRYATPDQLDAMAAAAGLDLATRHAGWSDEPFDDHSATHVSTYVSSSNGRSDEEP